MRMAVGLVVVLGFWACGSEDAHTSRPRSAPPADPPRAALSGRVRLADGFKLPRYAEQEMVRQVLRAPTLGERPAQCGPPEARDRMPVTFTADGSLAGVLVTASGFSHVAARPPKTHTVTIEHCRLQPALLAAVVGDELVLRNNVEFPFMPTFGPGQAARTLMPGQAFHLTLDRAGVESVLCAVTGPCGRTDVITVHHPLYAVTGDDGRFRLDDFPEDESVTLNAWHPLFDAAATTVRVGVGQEKEIELVIRPRSAPLDAAQPATLVEPP